MSYDMSDYVEVKERIVEFRDKHPDGSLQAEIVPSPVDGFVVVKGYAYRSPDDPLPGTGLAWEPVPGKTPFTKDSELQNAETSAWGRAIIAALAADAKRGIASANEVRNRAGGVSEGQHGSAAADAPPAQLSPVQQEAFDAVKALAASDREQVKAWMNSQDLPMQFSQLSDDDAKRVIDRCGEAVPF